MYLLHKKDISLRFENNRLYVSIPQNELCFGATFNAPHDETLIDIGTHFASPLHMYRVMRLFLTWTPMY
jgi:hypothetical protein